MLRTTGFRGSRPWIALAVIGAAALATPSSARAQARRHHAASSGTNGGGAAAPTPATSPSDAASTGTGAGAAGAPAGDNTVAEAVLHTEGGRRVYVSSTAIEVRGEIQRPYAFTLSGRSSLGYSYIDVPVHFIQEIINAVRRAPF